MVRQKTLVLLITLAFSTAGVLGCGGDDPEQNQNQQNQIGDGDGDAEPGDGDTDPDPGDGDTDPDPGDGDTDPDPGDGDGDTDPDPDPGDGDTDPDPDPGDGDTDPDPDPVGDQPTAFGQVVISEYMKAPTEVSAAEGQWIEFYNLTDGAFDLMGCEIESSAMSSALTISAPLPIGSGQFVTIANSANAGFVADLVLDDLLLSTETGGVMLSCDGELVATALYPVAGYYPSTPGVSVVRDPDFIDLLLDEPFVFCEGTGTYHGADIGSPGEMAEPCPWYDGATAAVLAQLKAAPAGALDPAVAVENALVTHASAAAGGFFVQASDEGPGIFVAQDPGAVGVRTGMVISFVAEAIAHPNDGVRISAIDTDSVEIIRLHIPPQHFMATDVADATDLISELDDYEHMLFRGELTITGNSSSSGGGHSAYPVNPGFSAGGTVQLRMPISFVNDLGLSSGCVVEMLQVPLWRWGSTAQFGLWNHYDIDLSNCDLEPLHGSAANETTVVVTFNRLVENIAADGSQFTIAGLTVSAAEHNGRVVTLTTSTQDPGTTYTVEIDSSVQDIYGQAVVGDVEFDAFVPLTVAITEFMARYQAGTNDPGEYIEITNLGSTDFNFNGCLLGKNMTANGHYVISSDIIIGPGESALFTSSAGGDANLEEDDIVPFNNLVNTGDTIFLECGGEELDRLTYPGSAALLGISYQKDVNFLSTPNPPGGLASVWCATPQEPQFEYHVKNGDSKYGTPGTANTTCD